MKGVMCGVVLACALAFAPAGLAVVTLYPLGGGSATAVWQPQQGLPDTVGVANQALVLQKDASEGAATAVFNGVAGAPAQSLTGLEWERRLDGECVKISPRLTLAVAGKSGRQYLVRFGCAQAGHEPGSALGWVRDVNSQTLIRTRLLQAGGKDALVGTIVSLSIVYDQRGSKGFTVLDNIRISSTTLGSNVWTSPADNAATVMGLPMFVLDDLAVDPFSASELLTLDEIWPTMTADDQAIAASGVTVTAD